MTTILHLIDDATWTALEPGAPVLNDSLPIEGFIHCTAEPEVLLTVANAFYAARPGPFLALHVDTDRLTAPLVWEPPNHPEGGDGRPVLATLFPHVYGPIDRDAVVATQSMRRDPSGAFTGYGEMQPI